MKLKKTLYSKAVPMLPACIAETEISQFNILPPPLYVGRTKGKKGLLLTLLLSLVLGFWGGQAKGQDCTGCATLTGIPTYTITGLPCSTYTLHGVGLTGDYIMADYTWLPTTGVVASSGTLVDPTTTLPDINFSIPSVCTEYQLSMTLLSTHNEIVDGDFGGAGSGGIMPTGFTSSYTPVIGNAIATTPNAYEWVTNPSACSSCTSFCPFADHTTGTGYMMMVNGNPAGTSVLNSSITLPCCSTKYRISFWLQSWSSIISTTGLPASLTVAVNGISAPSLVLPSTCGAGWQYYYFDFISNPCSSGGSTGNSINIVDITATGENNDFALDDFNVRRVCEVVKTITICPTPITDISGPAEVCVGATISLSDITPGGSWNDLCCHSKATISPEYTPSPSTVVSGVSPGTAIVTYSLGSGAGCSVTKTITVHPLPDFTPSFLPNPYCIGISGPLTLTAGTALGIPTITSYNWENAMGITFSTVASPVLPPITIAGTYTYTLTETNIYGCSKPEPDIVVAKSPPEAGTIWGVSSVCSGTTVTLSDPGATTGAGITYSWSFTPATYTTLLGTPGTSCTFMTNTVIGLPVTVTAILTVSNVCSTLNTLPFVFVIYPTPTFTVTATPPTHYCTGTTLTLSETTTPGTCDICTYLWTATSFPPFPVNTATTGTTIPIAGTVFYTLKETNSYGCFTPNTIEIDPLPTPSAGTITGPVTVCTGTTITLSDVSGTISTGYPPYWTVSSSDLTISSYTNTTVDIYANSCGNEVVTYHVPSQWCGTTPKTYTVTAVATPTVTITSVPPAAADGHVINCHPTVLTANVIPTGCGGIPYFYNYMWDPISSIIGPHTAPSVFADPPGTVGDVFTVQVYNTTGACVSGQSIIVDNVKPTCVCNMDRPFEALAQSGVLGTYGTSYTVPPGYYVVSNDITIYGNVDISNSTIVMADGVSIFIAPGGGQKFTLNNSHLFCCPGDMWQGIQVNNYIPLVVTSALEVSGQLELNNCLIEDAHIAVDVNTPVPHFIGYSTADALTSELLLYSHGTVFNKNEVGIKVEYPAFSIYNMDYSAGLGATTAMHPDEPFLIENTVFTSRDFSAYIMSTAAFAYPFYWPPTYGTPAALKTIYTPLSVYDPPYNIDNYPAATCNNGLRAKIGLELLNIGNTNGSAGVGGEIYSGFVLGGPLPVISSYNEDRNLFDHLTYGIYAHNSSLLCRNNAFTHIYADHGSGGTGIYAFRDPTAANNNMLYKLNVYGDALSDPARNYNNKFWDCSTGVETYDLYYTRCNNAEIYSKHGTATAIGTSDPQGKFGFKATSTSYYDVDMSYNYIINISNGISFINLPPAAPGELIQQDWVTVNNNEMHAVNPLLGTSLPSATLGEFIIKGINVEYLRTTIESTVYQTNVDNNKIDNAYNGIYILGSGGSELDNITTTNTNLVSLLLDPAATAPQTGIDHESLQRAYIYGNTVSGPGYNIPVPTPGPYTYPVIEAIHTFVPNNVDYVSCNTVKDINTGFYFGGPSVIQWTGNHMNQNDMGFVLDGTIGNQPWLTFGATPATTGNEWDVTATSATWPGWGGITGISDPWQTLVNGLVTLSYSTMTVQAGSPQEPTHNGNSMGVGSPKYYSGLGGAIVISTAGNYGCVAPSPVMPPYFMPVFVGAATLQTGYTKYADEKNWIAQMQLYNAIQADTTLDTNVILHVFDSMAANSRYALLTAIAGAISAGYYSQAGALLNYPTDSMSTTDTDSISGVIIADGAGGDAIVKNYKDYYSILIKYMTDVLDANDSAEVVYLANLCPQKDGIIVTAARGLYSLLYNDLSMFSDISCDTLINHGMRKGKPRNTNSILPDSLQQYTIIPNPNSGNMTISQLIPDGKPVNTEVLNATGEPIYKGQLQFINGSTNLFIVNKIHGLYLLRLLDAKGQLFAIKFVIE